jgi:monoamine oxidase
MKNFLFLFLILFAQFLFFKSKPYDVIIIGAGASGIAAANKLSQEGPNNFNVKILEARNRIGGRISTDFKTFGYPIDLGAIHITRQKDNPILHNAYKNNLKLVSLNRDDNLMFNENNKIFRNGNKTYGVINSRLLGFIKKNYIKYKNSSVKYVVDQFREKNKLTPIEKIFLISVAHSLNFGLKRPLYDLKDYLFAGAPSFNDEFFMTPDGYIKTLEPEASKFNIQFNTVITSINQENQGENFNKITLTDHKGNKYVSDYVILTVPLGYLKKDLIKFTPDLSNRKKEAIQKLGFFNMNKIFIEFEEKFWPDSDYFTLLTDPFICDAVVNMKNIYKNRNLILFLISEDRYEILREKSEVEIQEMILKAMRSSFPQHKNKMKITKFFMTNWNDDPFTYGSFSEPGGHEYLRRRFEEPEGRLIFAGEHTCRKFNAYVYGAYQSGIRAAEQIMSLRSST